MLSRPNRSTRRAIARRDRRAHRGAVKAAVATVVGAASLATGPVLHSPPAVAATLQPTVAAATDANGGGWTVSAAGQVGTYGGAPSYGDLSGHPLNRPIVGMASTADGKGYWLVASDGGVFSFGDAAFYGSTGNLSLNRPIVGMASTADGRGYWLVASDGGVFSFGDAAFYGSTGNLALWKPVVAMASSPDGRGYWLVASDGGVFTFGDARFFGSTGALPLVKPVIGMVPTRDGAGYWMVASDGGVFTFGDANFTGSLAGQAPSPVVGMVVHGSSYQLVDAGGQVLSPGATSPASSTAAPSTAASAAAPPSTAASPPVATAAATAAGGINFGGAYEGTYYDLAAGQQASIMSQVASSGVRWIRVDIPFSAVEPSPGQFNWYPDAIVRQAVAHGIAVDALISYPPGWATLADGSPDPTAFSQFASATASHLSGLGVSTYEIINEPNIAQNWGGAPNAAEYTTVLKASYSAIKAAQPGAFVLTGGLCPAYDTPGSSISPATFLDDIYADGGKGYFDAVADHPYSFPDMPLQADSWNQFYDMVTLLRSEMVAQGDGSKQIWMTEYGAPTAGSDAVSESAQAAMIQSAFAARATNPWMGPLFLFDWQDTSGDGAFGLLRSDGSAKPALAAMEQALGA